jgi:hypothetical protein
MEQLTAACLAVLAAAEQLVDQAGQAHQVRDIAVLMVAALAIRLVAAAVQGVRLLFKVLAYLRMVAPALNGLLDQATTMAAVAAVVRPFIPLELAVLAAAAMVAHQPPTGSPEHQIQAAVAAVVGRQAALFIAAVMVDLELLL